MRISFTIYQSEFRVRAPLVLSPNAAPCVDKTGLTNSVVPMEVCERTIEGCRALWT
jgi:hypothetical protein